MCFRHCKLQEQSVWERSDLRQFARWLQLSMQSRFHRKKLWDWWVSLTEMIFSDYLTNHIEICFITRYSTAWRHQLHKWHPDKHRPTSSACRVAATVLLGSTRRVGSSNDVTELRRATVDVRVGHIHGAVRCSENTQRSDEWVRLHRFSAAWVGNTEN